jgi:hypothetical protein
VLWLLPCASLWFCRERSLLGERTGFCSLNVA